MAKGPFEDVGHKKAGSVGSLSYELKIKISSFSFRVPRFDG